MSYINPIKSSLFSIKINNLLLSITSIFLIFSSVFKFIEKSTSIFDIFFSDIDIFEYIPYITAKSGLRGFSKSVALDLAPKGILVNMVSPGMTNTNLISEVPERVRMVASAKTPLKRLATAEDIAKVIAFLASDDSNYLCGETIRVNGGQVMI